MASALFRQGIESGLTAGAKDLAREGIEAGIKAGAKDVAREGIEAGIKAGAKDLAQEGAEAAVKQGAERTLMESAKIAAKRAAALGLVAGGAYIIYDANAATDRINNTPLTISSIINSPDNSGKIRITFSPGMLLSADDTIKFSGTNSIPNLSPEFIPLSSVIDVNNIEITGKLTTPGTTGIANAKTTLSNQAALKAKQAIGDAVDFVGDAADEAFKFSLAAIEKLLGLPPGTLKTIGYIIFALIVFWVLYKIYSMFMPRSAFGRCKKGRSSFGRNFGLGKRR
jgi:hypothetical protein